MCGYIYTFYLFLVYLVWGIYLVNTMDDNSSPMQDNTADQLSGNMEQGVDATIVLSPHTASSMYMSPCYSLYVRILFIYVFMIFVIC